MVGLFGQFWTKTTVDQRDDLFDNNKKSIWKDPITNKWKYETNLDRMADGLAPIGVDGKSINLHHIGQNELNGMTGKRGSLVELTQELHNKYNKQLHTIFPRNPNNLKQTLPRYTSFRKNNDGTKSILADQFDEYRSNYWKERANQIKNKTH